MPPGWNERGNARMASDSTQGDSQPNKPVQADRPASAFGILALGLGLIFLCLLLAYVFISLWPGSLTNTTSGDAESVITLFGTAVSLKTTVDARLLLLVMVTGALGSFVHTATSFSDFVGNQKLSASWVWWYVLRPFIAMALAAIFYVAIRAGFMTGGGQPNTINLFGIAAVSGMVGMFSKQATDKLSEVFDTLFRTAPGGGDVQRKNSLDSSVPVIRAIEPSMLAPGTNPAVVTVRGSGFNASSVVRVRDGDRPTVFKDGGELSVTLLPADVSAEGSLDLVVFTPPPGGGGSSAMSLRVAVAARAADVDGDGCAVQVQNPTPDAALPVARGGVG
jgi:hypothetical protein